MKTTTPYLISKLQRLSALLDLSEMKAFFERLFSVFPSLQIYQIGALLPKEEGQISYEKLLTRYSHYLNALKEGDLERILLLNRDFFLGLTLSADTFYYIYPDDQKVIIKPKLPILSLTLNSFSYLKELQEIKNATFGQESISWGVQFSYPQVFQDPVGGEVFSVLSNPKFVNSPLYSFIRKDLRKCTLPVFFEYGSQKVKNPSTPLRLGRNCFSWIDTLPQLKKEELSIK